MLISIHHRGRKWRPPDCTSKKYAKVRQDMSSSFSSIVSFTSVSVFVTSFSLSFSLSLSKLPGLFIWLGTNEFERTLMYRKIKIKEGNQSFDLLLNSKSFNGKKFLKLFWKKCYVVFLWLSLNVLHIMYLSSGICVGIFMRVWCG